MGSILYNYNAIEEKLSNQTRDTHTHTYEAIQNLSVISRLVEETNDERTTEQRKHAPRVYHKRKFKMNDGSFISYLHFPCQLE